MDESKMTTLREVAKLALDALHLWHWTKETTGLDAAHDALRDALFEPEQIVPSDCSDSHQPVAWLGFNPRTGAPEIANDMPAPSVMRDFKMRPLVYGDTSTPPQRDPLTNGEIYTAYITATNQTLRPQDERLAFAFARAIERAHGIGSEE
jgi:hypothetical protein